MIDLVKEHLEEIQTICKKYKVEGLHIFGSAINEKFDSDNSDLDFAVLFSDKIPVIDMADHYFGLIESLENLLKHPIDLTTLKSVKNPVFKKELEETMIKLYAA